MNFWQTLVISILTSSALIGLFGIYLRHYLQVRQSKTQKQQQLYGELLGLKNAISDCCVYAEVSRINFEYYNYWMQLSNGLAYQQSSQQLQTHQHYLEVSEFKRSELFSKLFKTLGLVWTTFPKDPKLNSLIKNCFAITPVHAEYPWDLYSKEELKKWRKDDIQKWRNDAEVKVRNRIKEIITEPLNALINYLRNRVIKNIENSNDKNSSTQ